MRQKNENPSEQQVTVRVLKKQPNEYLEHGYEERVDIYK
jgi:hypothetical protein